MRQKFGATMRWSQGCAALVAVLYVAGCEQFPDSDERWDDDVVATGYDTNADFGDYRTFAVDPTVYLLKALDDGGVDRDALPSKQADPIVDAVVSNLKERGYEEVASDDDPDLGVTLTAINNEVSGTVSGWWGGGYWGYGGWGYYYPYAYSYSYRTGSLVTEMVDLKRVPPPSDGGLPAFDGGRPDLDGGLPEQPIGLPVVWSSIAYQVLDSSGKASVGWATDSVDQAFEQSPYLERD